jgi:hypothetical protein
LKTAKQFISEYYPIEKPDGWALIEGDVAEMMEEYTLLVLESCKVFVQSAFREHLKKEHEDWLLERAERDAKKSPHEDPSYQ